MSTNAQLLVKARLNATLAERQTVTIGRGVSLSDLLLQIDPGLSRLTLAQLRQLNFDPASGPGEPIHYITDLNALFRYNATEPGTDNGSTILQDASGNRYTKTTLLNDLYNQ